MKNNPARRNFIKITASTGIAIGLGATLLKLNESQADTSIRDFSTLKLDPMKLCDLPEGFSYKIISKHGETMSDGHTVPDKHDGMGCFQAPNGDLVLVRNHEIGLYLFSNDKSPEPEFAYDKDSSGGCTTVLLDKDMNVKKHYLSLTGTIVNCSGGHRKMVVTRIKCSRRALAGRGSQRVISHPKVAAKLAKGLASTPPPTINK